MKIRARFPLEVGKTYYTRNGLEARIYATENTFDGLAYGEIRFSNGWERKSWFKAVGRSAIGAKLDSDITHEEWEPKEKELVWAWDTSYYTKLAGFYDAKNKCLFKAVYGERKGPQFSNYAPYEGEWPEWAKEAYKKLED